jgi:O-acetyl-ADP-ribose deacetylase (regulator of RNase III)
MPLISAGIFKCPPNVSANITMETIKDYIDRRGDAIKEYHVAILPDEPANFTIACKAATKVLG